MTQELTARLNAAWAQALVAGMAASGVEAVVVSPGSRSTPLVLAVASRADVRAHVVVDERSAAFVALGLAKSTGKPVALLCMKLAMMLGAAAGVRAQAHFGFFIGVHAAPPALRRLMLGFSRVLQVAIGLMLCVWGLRLCVQNWDLPMPGANLPQGVGYLPLSIGGALIGNEMDKDDRQHARYDDPYHHGRHYDRGGYYERRYYEGGGRYRAPYERY